MSQHELNELFAKKESGVISDAEMKMLQRILESKEKREEYNRLVEFTGSKNLKMRFNIKKSKERVINEIRKYEPDFTMGAETKPQSLSLNHWFYKVAAVLFVVIGIGSIIYIQQKGNVSREELAYQFYSTNPGQNLNVTLNDGSSILLNGGSRMYLSKNFSKNQREIWIEGEAYCQIKKDPKHPFTVNLGDYKVKVLGTTFNVDAYNDDNILKVALVEGKVKVLRENRDSLLLDPGEMLSFNKQTHKYTQTIFNPDNITGWKDKVFVFRNTPLDEVFKDLERRYGVKFVTGNVDISKFCINATFRDETFSTILKTIEFGTDLSFEMHDNKQIILTAK